MKTRALVSVLMIGICVLACASQSQKRVFVPETTISFDVDADIITGKKQDITDDSDWVKSIQEYNFDCGTFVGRIFEYTPRKGSDTTALFLQQANNQALHQCVPDSVKIGSRSELGTKVNNTMAWKGLFKVEVGSAKQTIFTLTFSTKSATYSVLIIAYSEFDGAVNDAKKVFDSIMFTPEHYRLTSS